MREQLPILQILLPLLAAPLCLLLRRRRWVLGFSIAVAWATFGLAGLLLSRVLDGGTLQYAMGGWPAPWGIEYRVDTLSGFVLLFVSGIGAVALTYAPASIAREIPQGRHYLFCTAYLLCLTGLLGITITNFDRRFACLFSRLEDDYFRIPGSDRLGDSLCLGSCDCFC